MTTPPSAPWGASATLLSFRLLLCLGAALGASALRAQEVSFLAGGAGLPNLRSSSFSWDLAYRQYLFQNLSASAGWINEGHVIGHHRDGTAAQLWVDLPMVNGRYTLSAGAGGYYYFDTEPAGNGDSLDVHGTAPIFSLSATAYVSDRLFVRLLVNRINPHNDFHSNTALLGLGYWFGRDQRPTPGKMQAKPAEARFVTGSEFTVYGGRSVVNAFYSEHGVAYAAEYRHGLSRHLDGSASFIYEGDPKITRRSGLGLQVWPVNTFFNEKVTIGIGLGVYVYIDNKHAGPSRQLAVGASVNTPAMAPLISPTFAVRLSDHWLVRFTWHRVVTNYNRDSDVYLLGAGFSWR
jgi:hypothetical protein